jgi:hypothetical protein
MPGQQRARLDEPWGAQHGWPLPGERRQDRPAGPVWLWPGDLTPQHHDLMTQHHDLRVLGRLAAAEQHQPTKDPDREQVEQTKSHEPRSWRNQLTRPQVTAPAATSEAVHADLVGNSPLGAWSFAPR